MTKRRWIVLALGVGGAVVVTLALAWFLVIYRSPLAVTVHNETGVTLSDLALVSGTGHRTAVSDVAGGQSVTVRPRVGPSEDHLTMLDAQGRRYYLLGYFEGDPGGQVTVTITGVSERGFTGRVMDETKYSPAGESTLGPTAQ